MSTAIGAESRFDSPVAEDRAGAVWRGQAPDGSDAWLLRQPRRKGDLAVAARQHLAIKMASLVGPGLCAPPLQQASTESEAVLAMADDGQRLLSELITDQGMPVAALVRTMLALARMTTGLHAAGIIHRDLRPARLLISPETGQARALSLECATTYAGQAGLAAPDIGASPYYAAPELTGRIEVPIDERADLYALGATFAEMISGRVLYTDKTLSELTYAHVARDIPNFEQGRADLPDMLARITHRLLQKDPDDRYASAFGLVRDLERCADQFARSGAIRNFELAATGVTTRFRLSDRLFGRESEQANLLAAVQDGPLQGRQTVVSIRGTSGIGKTTFVTHMRWHLVKQGVRLHSGKFDRFKRDQPYIAFIQSAQSMIRPILSADKAVLTHYKKALRDKLGKFAGLLTELIPELDLLIGPQPTPEDIPPAEANRRFISVVQRFIAFFATRENPVIIFLDDVQWADNASLNLLRAITQMPGLEYFMLVLGYRDTEVGPSHPARQVIDGCHDAATLSVIIQLDPLSKDHVAQVLAASLDRPGPEVDALARHVHRVSDGNALFMREYLTSLAATGALFFDRDTTCWNFDTEALTSADVPGSVAGFLTERLQNLPPQTLDLLDSASCIGSPFGLETLAWVSGIPKPAVAAMLSSAIRATIIVTIDENHAVLAGTPEDADTAQGYQNAWYKFRHDQIRQVVHDRLAEAARAARHLLIARLMLQSVEGEKLVRRAVEIFGHVLWTDKGLIAPDEIPRFARLGLMAAEQAQLGLAFESARQYLQTVEDILGRDGDHADEALWLDLLRQKAKCAFALNDRDGIEESALAILERTSDPYDIADIQGMRIRYLSTENQAHKAADLCIEVAAELDVRLPRHPGLVNLMVEVIRTMVPQGTRDPRGYADLPEAENSRVRAAVQLLAQSAPAAYFSEPNLLPLLGISATRLSLKYGLSPHAPYSFAVMALVLCGALGMINRGYKFGELALETAERYGGTHASRAQFVVDTFVRHWKEPLPEVVKHLFVSWVRNREAGNQEDATYCAGVLLYADFLSGRNVDTPGRHPEVIEFLRQTDMPHIRDSFLAWAELLQALGEQDLRDELSGPDFDYPTKIRDFERVDSGVQVAISSIAAGVLDHLSGRYQRAEQRFALAARYESNIISQVLVPGLAFLRALNAYWLAEADPAQAARMRRIATVQSQRLKFWNRSGPVNLAHRLALLKAERLAAKGRHAAALMALHETCTLAGPEAYFYAYLAHRRRFRILREAGHSSDAREAARQAGRAAHAWGAPGLANALHAEAGITTEQPASTEDGTLAEADLKNFMDLVGAVSIETRTDKLLAHIATVAVTAGNADFCALSLSDEEREAGLSYQSKEPGAPLSETRPLETAPVPLRAVIDLCLRTKEPVHSDTPAQEAFADGFDGELPRALFCVPMVQNGRVLGALYLHSYVTRYAFAPSRRALVRALADQAAIALQNRRLLGHVQNALESQTRQTEANRRFVPEHLMKVLGQDDITKVDLNQYAETDMTAVFADIRGFTSISHDIGAKRTIQMINRYLDHVQPGIAAHGGFVGNYMGDGLLALFPDGPDFALFGIQAMARGLAGYNADRGDLPQLSFGAGVHFGHLTLGMIGDVDHIQVGVLGNPVNMAARLDDLNKEFGSRVLVSHACVARLAQPYRFTFRSLGNVRVRGLQSASGVFELLDIHDDARRAALAGAQNIFGEAVNAMDAGKLEDAAALFGRADAAAGGDPVAARLAKRCGA